MNADGDWDVLNDNVYDIGASNNKYANVYATTFNGTATQAQFADLAEKYLADKDYEIGTVLVFGGDKEVTQSMMREDTRIAGVVSENPGFLMNKDLEGDHVVSVALQGRVPVKVTGTVRKGDMLITSTELGHAIVGNDPKVGSVIGKAIEEKTDPGVGIVEALVGRA